MGQNRFDKSDPPIKTGRVWVRNFNPNPTCVTHPYPNSVICFIFSLQLRLKVMPLRPQSFTPPLNIPFQTSNSLLISSFPWCHLLLPTCCLLHPVVLGEEIRLPIVLNLTSLCYYRYRYPNFTSHSKPCDEGVLLSMQTCDDLIWIDFQLSPQRLTSPQPKFFKFLK